MEKIQQHLVKIIKQLIKEEDDRILNVRGGKGYGTGHPSPIKSVPPLNHGLGDPGPYEDNNEDIKKQEPVKISRAFKKE